MLYNHERSLKATEERIRNSSINEANKKHIFEFESYCFSDGLKIARVLKHLIELKVLAEMVGQDFKSMPKQDMMTLVGRIERMDREERTKQDYKSLIRKFFRWLGREDIVDWIKIPLRKDSRKLPEDMLSEEEIEKMINACEHPRDKAMVACLYESGTRISELGDIKIKHVKFDQYGAVLIVDGKTGMRRVRIIFSSPYLATWLENHPFRDNPEAFVWVGIVTDEKKDVQMSPKKCTRCSLMNSPTTKFCSKCGLALDIKAALEMEEKSSEITMDFMQVARNDLKIMDFMKMFMQSVSAKA